MPRTKPTSNVPSNPRPDHPQERAVREFEREGQFQSPDEPNPTLRPDETPHPPAESPPPSDDDIRQGVEGRIAEVAGVDTITIKVQVERGVVRLQGRVFSEASSAAAERAASSVVGVREVRNDLAMQPTTAER
jgi:HSP20 family molecular chaperone IbpA